MMELAGNFRPYNGCIAKAVVIGTPSGEQRSMYRLVEAFLLREPLGQFYKIHRSMLDAGWFGGHRYAACGYPLSATDRPSWMDVPPMVYAS
jgi:Xaa-Pro dipeptidase